MFCAFFSLLMLCGGVGVLVWLGWQRVSRHLKANPEAAELIARHVIAPLLLGKEDKLDDKLPGKLDVKKTKGTLV